MGERSLFTPVLLAVMAVLAAFAIYTINDNISLARQKLDSADRSMSRIASGLEELNKTLKEGARLPIADNAGNANTAAKTASDNSGNATIGGNDATAPGRSVVSLMPGAKDGGKARPANRFLNEDLRDPKAEDGDCIISYATQFSGSMNSIIKNESLTSAIWGYCNDSLGGRHSLDMLRFEPQLAESWERSADGLVYTIKLRKNSKWQPFTDPETQTKWPEKEVTADDFVFWWQTINNPDVPASAIRSYYEMVKSIEAVDDYTLRVTWREPYSLADEFTLGLSPLPRHYYRPESDAKLSDKEWALKFISSPRNQFMIGCGAYRIAEYEKGKGITLDRFEDYYGLKPPLRRVVIREIHDPTIGFNEFKKGNLDNIGLRPVQWMEESNTADWYLVTPKVETCVADSWKFCDMKSRGELPSDASPNYKFEKYQYPTFSYYYVGYNMRRPLFQDRKVRTALTHLINREKILKDVYYNLGSVISGPFVPQSPYYDQSVKPYPFDPERATELLKEAGWEDTDGDNILDKDLNGDGKREPFQFAFMTISSSDEQRQFAVMIQQDMRKAGIKMEIKSMSWDIYLNQLEEKSFDVCSLGWSGGIEVDPNQIWHSRYADEPKSSNHVGYKSAEADALIDKGRRTLDVNQRIEIYHEFHRLLHRDQPYTFMFVRTALVTYEKRYRNLKVFPGGINESIIWTPKALQRTF